MYFWSATRLPTTAVVWRTDGAITSLTAIAKATFAIEIGDADLAQVQEPVATFVDATPTSPSDLAPFKARADVLVVGSAFPARTTAAPFKCRVAVGTVDVTVEVGPRSPQPLAALGPRPPDASRGVSRWNVAPPAQQLDALPDEIDLTLEHLSALGPVVQMSLPALHLSVYAEGGGITGTHPMRADTLWVDTDRQIACITYRATFSPRDDSEIRATILADHPALQQDPAALVLLELDDPSDDDDDLPMETGLVPIPSLDRPAAERPLSRDGLPFRPAAAGAPSLALTPPPPPPPRAPAPTGADEAPATIPPPPISTLGSMGAGALGAPMLAPPLVPVHAPPLGPVLAPPLAPPMAPPLAPPSRPGLAPLSPPVMAPQAPVPARVPALTQPFGLELIAPPRVEPPAPYKPIVPVHRFEPTSPPERLAHDAGAVHTGLAGASDAAAHATPHSHRRSWGRKADVERPRPTSNDICDLVWLDPELAPRVRQMVDWASAVRDHSVDRGWLGADETFEESQLAGDRRVVMRALARVTPAEVSTLPRLLAESTDDDGFVSRPLLVVAGELSLPPDPHEVLKTTIELAKPFATVEGDKPGTPTSRLKVAIDSAGEALGGVEAPLARIRQAFAALARGLPTDYLEKTVDETLIEERRYRVRELFGGNHVWCQIQAGTGTPTTVYLAEEAVKLLPMAPRFRVRAIVEPHALQNRADGDGPVLRALAVARVIAQRPR